MSFTRRLLLKIAALCWWRGTTSASAQSNDEPRLPFGTEFPNLDSLAVGEWWNKPSPKGPAAPPKMDVPRDQVVAFALYTHDNGVLKLTAQLYPLKPGEQREARLEFRATASGPKRRKAEVDVSRLERPFSRREMGRHAMCLTACGTASGDLRRLDSPRPARQARDRRRQHVVQLQPHDRPAARDHRESQGARSGPAVLRGRSNLPPHRAHGRLDRVRPAIPRAFRATAQRSRIPDDHDVGHPNLWGENGKRSLRRDNSDGGYFYPVEYVNMVQRQQTWHLPDPVDPRPSSAASRSTSRGFASAAWTSRSSKTASSRSGPQGKIPQQGPRPDHINDPAYDPKSIDLAGLELLGDRQLRFLRDWGQDWTGAEMKAVLSQTAFCGAVHMHGTRNARLLADLDCNGWPQTGRNRALEEIRRAWAVHLCGDQHLAVVVKHGIDRVERRTVRLSPARRCQHDLRPLVASARREARTESARRQPTAVDRRFHSTAWATGSR